MVRIHSGVPIFNHLAAIDFSRPPKTYPNELGCRPHVALGLEGIRFPACSVAGRAGDPGVLRTAGALRRWKNRRVMEQTRARSPPAD